MEAACHRPAERTTADQHWWAVPGAADRQWVGGSPIGWDQAPALVPKQHRNNRSGSLSSHCGFTTPLRNKAQVLESVRRRDLDDSSGYRLKLIIIQLVGHSRKFEIILLDDALEWSRKDIGPGPALRAMAGARWSAAW